VSAFCTSHASSAYVFSERRPNFGNGGEVENLLVKAKTNYTKRIRGADAPIDTIFEPQDFDPDFDRASHASDNLHELFKDVVGCEEIVTKLQKYQNIARNASRRNKEVSEVVPTSFVFKGPPGNLHVLIPTGKHSNLL